MTPVLYGLFVSLLPLDLKLELAPVLFFGFCSALSGSPFPLLFIPFHFLFPQLGFIIPLLWLQDRSQRFFFLFILILLFILNRSALSSAPPNFTYTIFTDLVFNLIVFSSLSSSLFKELYHLILSLNAPGRIRTILLALICGSMTSAPPDSALLLRKATSLPPHQILPITVLAPAIPPAVGALPLMLKELYALSFSVWIKYVLLSFAVLFIPISLILPSIEGKRENYSLKKIILFVMMVVILLMTELKTLPYVNAFLYFFLKKETEVPQQAVRLLSSIPHMSHYLLTVPVTVPLTMSPIMLIGVNLLAGTALGPIPTALVTITLFGKFIQENQLAIPAIISLSYLCFITPPVWEVVTILGKDRRTVLTALYVLITACGMVLLMLRV